MITKADTKRSSQDTPVPLTGPNRQANTSRISPLVNLASSSLLDDPQLIFPTDGGYIKEYDQVTFDWSNVSSPNSPVTYQLYIDNNETFGSPEVAETSLTESKFITSLEDGEYYWKVTAKDGAGNTSPGNTVYEFGVGCSINGCLSLSATDGNDVEVQPGGSSSSDSITFTFSRGGTIGAFPIDSSHWECALDGDIEFPTFENCGTVDGASTSYEGLALGSHRFLLRIVCDPEPPSDCGGAYSGSYAQSPFDWTISEGGITITSVTPPTPKWGFPVDVEGTITGAASDDKVVVDWGDDTTPTDATLDTEGQWVARHEYRADDSVLQPSKYCCNII